MLHKCMFGSFVLLAFFLQYGATEEGAGLTVYIDDEDCTTINIARKVSSDDQSSSYIAGSYQEVFDVYRRLLFPRMNVTVTVAVSRNISLSGNFIHPHSKHYVINIKLGVLNLPKYMRIFIIWTRSLVQLNLKAKTFMFRLVARMFRLSVEWPLHRPHLILSKDTDMVMVLRYALQTMFPEWPAYQIDAVFDGYASGAVSLVVVYKRIFRLMYPEWPELEVNPIFDGSDSLVVVLQRLFEFLFPNWPNTKYVFEDSVTTTVVMKKLFNLVLPTFDLQPIVSAANSPLIIIEKALIVMFPGWPTENMYLLGWLFLKLFHPLFVHFRPQFIYYKSVSMSDQKLLDKWLADIKLDVKKEISSSPVDLRHTFLTSFGDSSPYVKDLFDDLFGEFYGSPQPTPIVINTSNVGPVITFGKLSVTSSIWNAIFPEVPLNIQPPPRPSVLPRPAPPSDGSGLDGGLGLFTSWSSISNLPVLQDGISVSGLFCRPPNASYQTITFDIWRQKVGASGDDVLSLLLIDEPGFDTNVMKSEIIVPERLMKLLINWDEYEDKLTLQGKVPVMNVIRFFVPVLLYNWPAQNVMPVVSKTTSIRVILQRIFEHMFDAWRPFLQDSTVPMQLIFQRLLLLIVPDLPKSEVQLLFDGDMSLHELFKRLFNAFFPDWPQLKLGYIPKHINVKIVQNLLGLVYNWPKYETTLEVNSSASLAASVKNLIQQVVPELPAPELDMVVYSKVGLSLLISRFISILNPAHVIPLDVELNDKHTLVLPYWVFDVLFYKWPFYEADPDDKELKTSPTFGRCLNWLRSQMVAILKTASCTEPIVYSWVGELTSTLLEYSIETLPSVVDDKPAN